MSNTHWILAVLEDLRRYAAKHGLTDLERQLAQASQVAGEDLPGAAAEAANGRGKETAANSNASDDAVSEEAAGAVTGCGGQG